MMTCFQGYQFLLKMIYWSMVRALPKSSDLSPLTHVDLLSNTERIQALPTLGPSHMLLFINGILSSPQFSQGLVLYVPIFLSQFKCHFFKVSCLTTQSRVVPTNIISIVPFLIYCYYHICNHILTFLKL